MNSTNMTALLAAMRKKFLNNEAEHRIWLLLGGGALNGAYGAGVVTALVNSRFRDVFDGVIGVSTGIPTAGYFLSMEEADREKNLIYSTVYSDEARSHGFIKPRFRTDIHWLVQVFRGSTDKPIHWSRVAARSPRLVGVVTEWESGRPAYIEPQSEEEFFDTIAAGCSMPVAGPPVQLRGILMTDSVVSDPCPIDWLMSLPEHERPTHVLVIANAWHTPPTPKQQQRELLAYRTVLKHRAPRRILERFALRHRHFHRDVRRALERTDVTVAVEWLPWSQKGLNRNPHTISALTRVGYETWMTLLSQHKGDP